MNPEQLNLFPEQPQGLPEGNDLPFLEDESQEPKVGDKRKRWDGKTVVLSISPISGKPAWVAIDEEQETQKVDEVLELDSEKVCEYCNDAVGGCPQCGFGRNKKK